MKLSQVVAFFLVAGLALLLSACAGEQLFTVTVITSGEHRLAPDETWEADVYLFDGDLDIEQGAVLDGRLVLLNGDVQVSGKITGDVYLLNGTLVLAEGSYVQGPLHWAGGVLERDPAASVPGGVRRSSSGSLPLADRPAAPPGRRFLSAAVSALLLGTLSWLGRRFTPRNFTRMQAALKDAPVVCSALGGLVFIVTPALLVTMAFTLVLIPLVIAGLLLAMFVAALGLAVVGAGLADWIGRRMHRDFDTPAAAFLGTAGVSILAYLFTDLGFLGALLALVLLVAGVGAVLLTRFGWVVYVRPQFS